MAINKKVAKTARVAKVAAVAGREVIEGKAGKGSKAAALALTPASAPATRAVAATAATTATPDQDLAETARFIRVALVNIECASTKSAAFSLPAAHRDLQRAVDCLERIYCGPDANRLLQDAAERERAALLLVQASGLRKTAMRVLLGKVVHVKLDGGDGASEDFVELCRIAVVRCVLYLDWFANRQAGENADGLSMVKVKGEKGDKEIAIEGLVGTFVESALFCMKSWVARGDNERKGMVRGGACWQGGESALGAIRLFVLRLRDDSARRNQRRGEDAHACQWLKELDILLLKISHLYTSAFLKRKAADDHLDERTVSLLAQSVTAVQNSPREIKDQASYATKLEKLGAIYERSDRLAEASAMYDDAIKYQLELGVSPRRAEIFSHSHPDRVLGPGGRAEALGRVVLGFVRVSAKISHSKYCDLRWWDDENISDETRGILLEWQLEYICSQSGTDQDRHQVFIKEIVRLLCKIYKCDLYTPRRKRLMIILLQTRHASSGAYDKELDELRVRSKLKKNLQTEDPPLATLNEHYDATLLAFQAFKGSPDANTLEQALQMWENIVSTVENDDDLRERIDSRSLWITQLNAISDFYNMKGMDDLRVRSLETLARGLQVFRPLDEDLLLATQCKLGRQYLKVKYSNRAGIVLAKAQKLLSSSAVQTATRLEWHLAYAEYLMSIGNQEKWYVVLLLYDRALLNY